MDESNAILEEIIFLANGSNDIVQFGRNVATELYTNGCISEAVYRILVTAEL